MKNTNHSTTKNTTKNGAGAGFEHLHENTRRELLELSARGAAEIETLERAAREGVEPNDLSLVALLLHGLVTDHGPVDPLGAILEAIAHDVDVLSCRDDLAAASSYLRSIHRRLQVAHVLREREVRARDLVSGGAS